MIGLGLLALVVQLILLAVIVMAAVGAFGRLNGPGGQGSPGEPSGQGIRRFFQYLMLLGLFLAASAGISGLLGLLLRGRRDPIELAQSLTFVLVAVPILLGLGWWTRRTLQDNPREASAAALSRYVTAASLIALIMTMTAAYRVLSAVLGARAAEPLGPSIAALAVWGAGWLLHRAIGRRVIPDGPPRAEQVLGAALGLGVGTTGAVFLLGSSLRALLGTEDALVLLGAPTVARAAALLLVGLGVGFVYWSRELRHGRRDGGWLALVLLLGTGGGLALALVGTSLFAYTLLVWLLGEPGPVSASEHFWSAPTQLAAALVGALVWWYHRSVLAEADPDAPPTAAGPAERTEVRRLYDYLLSGIALIGAAAGLVLTISTLVESATTHAVIVGRATAINTLLAAVTLLAVGLPVWWWHWNSARRARAADLAGEVTSPTRRAYLLLLFGVAGVTAVIALLVAVNTVLQALLTGDLGAVTWLDVRVSLGVLVAASMVCAYHWGPFRADRAAQEALRIAAMPDQGLGEPGPGATAPSVEAEPGAAAPSVEAQHPAASAGAQPAPAWRTVTLVGPPDPQLARLIAGRPETSLYVLARRDAPGLRWDHAAVLAALDAESAGDLLVLAQPDGALVVPVRAGAGAWASG